MSPHLADDLYARYPKIFADRHLPANQSCMPRGIATGDGWFFLIDALCTVLQWEADHGATPQPVATQVKEKRGSLRLRLRQPSERQRGMLALALEVSTRLCEIKKKPVDVGQTSSLSARMADLARPVNPTFSRETCQQLGLAETSLEEFSIAVSSKYTLSFVQVPIGRAELEEYLVLRWRESLTNKPAARLLKGPQYSWVVAV